MTRKLALILAATALAVCGCDKIKLPKFGKKPQPAAATPAPVELAGAKPIAAPPPAPPPPVVEPVQPGIDTTANVIVLCYHRVEEKPRANDPYAITPAQFENEMEEVKAHGFSVIPMQDFLAWRRKEKAIPPKSCVITIDDGYRSGYSHAWPILKKHGYPFTMFIYTNFVKGQPNAGGQSLTWEELAEMRDAGVDIQSHSVAHQNLRAKTGKYQREFPTYEDWVRHEMVDSKKMLEQRLGIAVNCFAYPYGNHSEFIRKAAQEAGYEAAFTVYGQRLTHSSAAMALGRYAIESGKPQIFNAAMKMEGGGGGVPDDSPLTMNAAGSMITEPMEGETITNPMPAIRANLATLGDVDPRSIELRVSGIGAVPAKYDPATKMMEAQLTQKLRDRNYTVIVTGKAGGRKVQTSWNFNYDPTGGGTAGSPPPVAAPPIPTPAKNPRR
jgi:peptidoglycan/xylan/chitin deacetylase (PgdA/CDA1 family)